MPVSTRIQRNAWIRITAGRLRVGRNQREEAWIRITAGCLRAGNVRGAQGIAAGRLRDWAYPGDLWRGELGVSCIWVERVKIDLG